MCCIGNFFCLLRMISPGFKSCYKFIALIANIPVWPDNALRINCRTGDDCCLAAGCFDKLQVRLFVVGRVF